MNARENIVARIRAAYGRKGEAPAAEREAAQSYLRAHREGPRPKSDWDLLERFRERVVSLASTLDEVETMTGVPDAVARYLKRHNLPADAVCWGDLAKLDWRASGVSVVTRRAEGSDQVGITGCLCAIAETG